jgi:hypothetical protein
MNDTSLESILEEAFQSVLRSSFPHTTASIVIDHPIVDLSFSTAAVVADETVIHRENVDVSYSNQQNVSRSTSHVLHDTLILYQNYQENMRLYQNNVSMMVRHLQNIDRRSPFTRQRSRNSGDHEIHNFPFYGIFPVGTTGSSESYDIPTINHFTDDPELDNQLNFTFNKAQKRVVNAALSNTFGFGGHNACVIVKKYKA